MQGRPGEGALGEANATGAVPPAHHVLIELHNRVHLAAVYGEDFACAAQHALQVRVHLWGGSVVVVDEARFLAELPASQAPLDLIEDWRQALLAALFTRGDQHVCLTVGVDRVALRGRDCLDGARHGLHDIEGQGGIAPMLQRPQCGWNWRLRYEADMGAALALRQALPQGRASLFLQPIVHGHDSARPALYHEALLRLRMQPAQPGLSPSALVPALERLGLVGLLDQAVLAAVIARLEGDDTLRIGCNLSAQSLRPEQGGWDVLLKRLHQRPAVAARLTLEITESAPLPDFDLAVDLVKRLQQLGCQIAIDDFGSGHTRLDFVRAIQPQVIKLDAAVVNAATGSRACAEQLQRLGALAACWAPYVVAEGVRSKEQRLAVQMAGIVWMQGRALSPPVAAQPRLVLTLPGGKEPVCN